MKKSTKKLLGNLFGLLLTAGIYVLFVMPFLMGEHPGLPYTGKMLGAKMLWIIAFLFSSFLIPGIIGLFEYVKNKSFWRYFYSTGWIIFIIVLIVFSTILSNHSMN